MLVLSRKNGEKVHIGDNVQVTVVAIQGNRVKLAFTAPQHVQIQRTELRERACGASEAQIAGALPC